MIISDSDAEMTAANMTKVIKAAGASVDSFLPKLFCKTLEGKELKTFIDAAGKPGAGGGGGGGGEGGGQGRGGRGGGHGLRPLRLSGRSTSRTSTSVAERAPASLCWPSLFCSTIRACTR